METKPQGELALFPAYFLDASRSLLHLLQSRPSSQQHTSPRDLEVSTPRAVSVARKAALLLSLCCRRPASFTMEVPLSLR